MTALALLGCLCLANPAPGWLARMPDGKIIPFADQPPQGWFSIERAADPRPGLPAGAQCILANGDRIPAATLGGDDRSLRLKAKIGNEAAELRLPLTALNVVWINPPLADAARLPDPLDWLEEKRTTDRLRLVNGEVLNGLYEGFNDRDELQLRQAGAIRNIPLANINAIAFNPALAVARPPTGSWYRIVAANGTRISARTLELTADAADVTTSFGAKLTLPRSSLASITHWSKDLVPLGSLKPTREKVEPFGTVAWEWQIDRTVKNRPLTLNRGGRIENYDSGLGTHPRTQLTYALNGEYRIFAGTIGLDAITGRRGVAAITILVDDQPRTPQPLTLLAAADGPRDFQIDVAKARTLTLRIDFGPGAGVQADVNWIDARLIR